MSWKRFLFTGAFAGLIAFGASGTAHAQYYSNDCRNRIRQEERDYGNTVRRFGIFSRQASEERRELDILRSRCSSYNNRGFFGRDNRGWDRDDRRGRDNDRDDRRWRNSDRDNDRNRDRNRGRGKDHDKDHDKDRNNWRRH